MSLRELVVLGTASQVPTRHRNHNGYFVYFDGAGYMFDPGEGTQRQMIHYGVTATQITHVLVTHFHGDHCLGLASLVQRISLDEVPHDVECAYPASGQTYFERLRHASIFRDVAKIRPQPIRTDGDVSRRGPLTLSARRLNHTVDCFGYRVQETDQWQMDAGALADAGLDGPIVGRLKRDGHVTVDGREHRREDYGALRRGQSFAFVMDTRPCAGALELARDVDLLVCESTYLHTEVADAKKNGHMTARQAAELAREAGAKRLVLTHFSQRYAESQPFVDEAAAIHADVVAAQDGDRVAFPPR